MCALVGRSLDNDNNNTIGLFSAFHRPQRRFREQTCKVVVVENHVTHRPSPSFHSTLSKTQSSPIAPAEKNLWHRHWTYSTMSQISEMESTRGFKHASKLVLIAQRKTLTTFAPIHTGERE